MTAFSREGKFSHSLLPEATLCVLDFAEVSWGKKLFFVSGVCDVAAGVGRGGLCLLLPLVFR